MSTCTDRASEILPEYVLGILEPEEVRIVEDHLKVCNSCAQEVSVIRKLEDEIVPEPPAWYFNSLPERVVAHVTTRKVKARRALIPVWAGGLAVAAAAVLILLMPGPRQELNTENLDYSLAEKFEPINLGIEAEVLSVSGLVMEELDQLLLDGLEDVTPDIVVTMDLDLERDGYETMDGVTIRVFEDLIEAMTPERVRRKVIS